MSLSQTLFIADIWTGQNRKSSGVNSDINHSSIPWICSCKRCQWVSSTTDQEPKWTAAVVNVTCAFSASRKHNVCRRLSLCRAFPLSEKWMWHCLHAEQPGSEQIKMNSHLQRGGIKRSRALMSWFIVQTKCSRQGTRVKTALLPLKPGCHSWCSSSNRVEDSPLQVRRQGSSRKSTGVINNINGVSQ